MCTETGIKDVYRGVQGACPRRAVTHAGGTAERSERRAVGMGLKLVSISQTSSSRRQRPRGYYINIFQKFSKFWRGGKIELTRLL